MSLGELWDCQLGNLTAGKSSGGGGNGLSMVELGCRVKELRKMPNIRSGASMTYEDIEDLVSRRVAEEMEAREAAMNLEHP
ncbi:hypothetical protein Tco_1522858 [Tanacetum coccineum]